MNFPSYTEKDRSKNWHLRYGQAIVSNTINDSWSNQYKLIEELYKFLDAGSDGELTQHLQKAEDGSDLPAFWLTLNTLKAKIDLLLGELEERGNEIKVRAVNKEAIDRKIEAKESMRVQTRLAPVAQQAEEVSGIPLEDFSQVPQTERELDEYFDLSFKDKVELIMEFALKFCSKYNDWPGERFALFRDILAVNRCFTREEIYNGIPRSVRVHPLTMVFDTNSVRDDLSDATYFAEVYYMGIPEAVERYGLTDEEVDKCKADYGSYLSQGTNADRFNYLSDNRLKWFDNANNRILVVRSTWKDYKVTGYKEETGKNGSEHLQETKKAKDVSFSKKKELWRQCTILGGDIVKEWGEVPNQPRDLESLEKTECPYKGWIPNYGIGRGVSKVEQLVGLQLLKDITMYNIQLAQTRAGGRGLVYDLAMLPENWTPETAMKYLKTYSIAFVNSKESQLMPGNMNVFKEFDMSMSQTVQQSVGILAYLDAQMDAISGVSAERQGIVQGASQGMGVTQSALFQSNLITAPLFKGFERYCSRVQNHMAKLVKIAWANKEKFAPVIGDSGIDFLREHVDLDLDSFIAVESQAPQTLDRQKLESMIQIVLQTDASFIDDALTIMLEPDTKTAVRKFQKKRALRKVFEQQQMQAQQEQEQALQAKMEALQAQTQMGQWNNSLQLQDSKNKANLQKTALTGRVKLMDSRLDLMKEMARERNKGE